MNSFNILSKYNLILLYLCVQKNVEIIWWFFFFLFWYSPKLYKVRLKNTLIYLFGSAVP